MKIVIDIPKEDWEFLKASEGCRWSWTILEGVMNGIPLPKGHGRLKDADKVIEYWKPDHDRQFVADYFIHTLETANTVIEAESKQGNTENKRRTGKWKTFEYDGATFYECPKCEETGNVPTPFCPFCGEKLW